MIIILFIFLFGKVTAVDLLPHNIHKPVMNYIKKYLPHNPVIVEAGAYDGTDTINMSKFWPKSTIHSFEPVPEVFDFLKDNTKKYKNINIYNYALSDSNHIINFYVAKFPSGKIQGGSSVLSPNMTQKIINFNHQIKVKAYTLDEWSKIYSIRNIDFLWLDLQGYALPVLRASTRILNTVKVIYIEVEFVQAYKNQALYQDIKHFLEKNNFFLAAKDFADSDINKKYWMGNCIFLNKKIKKT